MSIEAVRAWLGQPAVPATWAAIVAVSVLLLVRDLQRNNAQIRGLMRWVWILTVLYSGPFGLWIYAHAGRAQIPRDDLFRRSLRSVAHCYSGCGAGEVLGVALAVGVLALPTWGVAALTFSLAFTFGLAFTVGPLMQDGVPFPRAIHDGLVAESASIVVMEATAIGVDLSLARDAGMDQPLFWSSLVVSLSLGLFAATPVNAWLIRAGVKEGMHDPRMMASTS